MIARATQIGSGFEDNAIEDHEMIESKSNRYAKMPRVIYVYSVYSSSSFRIYIRVGCVSGRLVHRLCFFSLKTSGVDL